MTTRVRRMLARLSFAGCVIFAGCATVEPGVGSRTTCGTARFVGKCTAPFCSKPVPVCLTKKGNVTYVDIDATDLEVRER